MLKDACDQFFVILRRGNVNKLCEVMSSLLRGPQSRLSLNNLQITYIICRDVDNEGNAKDFVASW